MKTIFIPAKSKAKPNITKIREISKKLPNNIAIAYSVQFQDIAQEIKQILSKDHKITKTIQVLGCSKPKFTKNTKALLLIGSGKFHAISLAQETKIPIYILNNNSFEKISQKQIQELKAKQKASLMKFLHADKVGILVSTKPGQQNLKQAIELKNNLKDKKPYILIANNLNTQEFENFNKIQSYINTACPRLDMESADVINIRDIN